MVRSYRGLVGWLAADAMRFAHYTSSVGTGHARDQSTPALLILVLYQRGSGRAYLLARRLSRTWSAHTGGWWVVPAASVVQPANGTSSVGTGHARDQSAPALLMLTLC